MGTLPTTTRIPWQSPVTSTLRRTRRATAGCSVTCVSGATVHEMGPRRRRRQWPRAFKTLIPAADVAWTRPCYISFLPREKTQWQKPPQITSSLTSPRHAATAEEASRVAHLLACGTRRRGWRVDKRTARAAAFMHDVRGRSREDFSEQHGKSHITFLRCARGRVVAHHSNDRCDCTCVHDGDFKSFPSGSLDSITHFASSTVSALASDTWQLFDNVVEDSSRLI